MEIENTFEHLEHSTKMVLSTALLITEDQWSAGQDDNRWSAAQIMEHIILSEGLIIRALGRKGKPCTERAPDEKIAEVKELFNNDELHLMAFGPIIPGQETKSREEQINSFQEQRNAISALAKKHDMTELIRLVKHPKFGEMTRQEWLWFYILHSERHTRQLKRLVNNL